jgi:hypothetical protein
MTSEVNGCRILSAARELETQRVSAALMLKSQEERTP